jgi:methionine sulfoxide reductase heme-binding subunit
MITAIDFAAFVGLTAVVLLTLNILLGLLVSTNYNPARQWPRRKLPWPLFRIHNWTGYIALAVVALHPVSLLFVDSKVAKFGVRDVLLPVWSQGQTLYNCLGAIALYGFALVVATSYFRPKLGYRPWKKLHYTAYFAAASMFLHGTLIDQNLKNATPDYLDGEKVLVEGCFAVVVAASVWRWRRGSEKQRHRAAKAAKAA